MIDINELRRLAQAATPGPWINHGRQPNVAGLPHSAVAAKTLLARVYSEAYGDVEQETANASFIAAANPATISELLDRLEAAESDALEQARLNGMGGEREAALMAKLEAAEKSDAESIAMYRRARDERDALRALVVMRFDHDYPPQFTQGHDLHELTEPVTAEHCRWFVAEIERLRTDCDALRAKIEAMEKQEPVATVRINAINGNPSVDFVPGHHYLHHNDRLYLAPGAQPAPSVPEGWKLVPTAESRHPGIYKMLGALHAIDNTRGASEWESYAAMLAVAPEAKP